MLAGALLFFVGVAGANRLIDPYGVWRGSLVDGIYRKRDGGYRVTTPYLLRVEQPETVLVGSSRVLFGMAIAQGCRDGVLNAALPGATLDEIAVVIGLALHNPRLRRVVWGVDFYAFDEGLNGFRDPLFASRLDRDRRLLVRETLLSFDALYASGRLLLRAMGGRERLAPAEVAPLPWPPQTIERALAAACGTGVPAREGAAMSMWYAEWLPPYRAYRLSPRQVAVFRNTVARVQAAGIEVLLFVPPLSAYELAAIQQLGQWDAFERWKRELSAVAPYWDFSGYNDLAFADHLFLDVVHFKPEVGHVILRRLLGRDCHPCGEGDQLVLRAGAWVDAGTVDAHLANQSADRRMRAEEASRYGQRLAVYLSQPDQPPPHLERPNPAHLRATGGKPGA